MRRFLATAPWAMILSASAFADQNVPSAKTLDCSVGYQQNSSPVFIEIARQSVVVGADDSLIPFENLLSKELAASKAISGLDRKLSASGLLISGTQLTLAISLKDEQNSLRDVSASTITAEGFGRVSLDFNLGFSNKFQITLVCQTNTQNGL